MDVLLLGQLVRVHPFPPVVHPRHARELLADGGASALAEWTGGYAIVDPDHRRMLEEILAALAWGKAGRAVLVNGLYGAGKSHLLVLLHLLTARPSAWDTFLEVHPTFRRYAQAMQGRPWRVIHFSLDEYGPQVALEEAVRREVVRALGDAAIPKAFLTASSRHDAWAALLAHCREHGEDGLLLLVDELSLFLAGKSPARREEDAAFLQFLAGWTERAPVWLLGALQRNLADVGALRTHSWRQVEDRFRRYTLSPQEIGRALCEKLLRRTDPVVVRTLVAAEIAPAAVEVGLTAGELQLHWPFHPAAVSLLMSVVGGYLSPHRSAVDVLQQVERAGWLDRSATRLITPLDLFALVLDDVQRENRLERLWSAVQVLRQCAAATPDPALAQQVITLLALLHLTEREAPLAALRALLFDGRTAPSLPALSAVLHALRRRGAYLAVVRDADPAAERFYLALGDEAGALALSHMQEAQLELAGSDPRVTELALQACTDAGWPLAAALPDDGMRLEIPWCGSTRAVQVALLPTLDASVLARQVAAVQTGAADGLALFAWPGQTGTKEWPALAARLSLADAVVCLFWLPRALTAFELELWQEYAAWRWAAADPLPPATARARQARQRCLERAEELRPAVTESVRRLYLEGRWQSAQGEEGCPAQIATLSGCLAEMLTNGLAARYPVFATLAAQVPTRAITQQLLQHLIEPGEAQAPPQSLLGGYIDRYLLPLGCVAYTGALARVTAPPWELLASLFSTSDASPLPWADALAALRKPPCGLADEQARLLLFSAMRVGAVRGLDGFLHPLDPDRTPLAHSDALAFIAPFPVVEGAMTDLVAALAAHWQLPELPLPQACALVERTLHAWGRGWHTRLPALRATLAEWSTALQVLPWGWQETERCLAVLASATGDMALDAWLTLLAQEDGVGVIRQAEQLMAGVAWWQAHREEVTVLLSQPGTQHLRELLAVGENAFTRLSELSSECVRLLAAHNAAYRQWHEATFGAAVVEALRQAFDAAEFRAVKALARLPLPLPAAAADALHTLSQARAGYCPGVYTQLTALGCCARCRLPLGSPSPLPDARQIRTQALAALDAYAVLLAAGPWVDTVRGRLAAAPEEIAVRVTALLAWRPGDGAAALPPLLDDALLAWLARDAHTAGVRQLSHLHRRLHGRELALPEARTAFLAWLDPDGELGEGSVLRFE